MRSWSFTAEVWLWPGEAAWHFVSLPKDLSAEIKEFYQGRTRGWGSLPVEATLGQTIWQTSIFPDNKSGQYLLPLKASVRKAEAIVAGSNCKVGLEILA